MNSGFVLDTNIILYSLAGDRSITKTLAQEELFVSAMARMEALVYHGFDARYLPEVREFLDECSVVEINRAIQDMAVDIRMGYKLQLPDPIIAATASTFGLTLLTADKGFVKLGALIEVDLFSH